MASRSPAKSQPIAPRLYLMTPPVDDADAFAGTLAAALAKSDIAAVLLRLKTAAESEMVRRIKKLAPVVQDAGAALLLDGHSELAGRSGADGAHLTGIHAFQAAVERLKPERIAGAGGLNTRHDAMLAAEAGADYVMFGEPDLTGERPRLGAIEERVAWWAEVFQSPCVAFAGSLDEIGPLAQAGADFVAVGDCIWSDPRGPAAALSDAAQRLTAVEHVG